MSLIETVGQPMKVQFSVSETFKKKCNNPIIQRDILQRCTEYRDFFNRLPLLEMCQAGRFICLKCFEINTSKVQCRFCKRFASKQLEPLDRTILLPSARFYAWVGKNINPEYHLERLK